MIQIYPWFKKEILKLNQAKYTKNVHFVLKHGMLIYKKQWNQEK